MTSIAEANPTMGHVISGTEARAEARFEVIDPTLWDGMVGRFAGVSQEQLATFAAARWPRVSLEPVLFSDRDGPIGGSLMMIQRLPLGLAAIAVSKWGPFLASLEGDAMGRYGKMVEALVGEYADRRGMLLSLLPLPALEEANADLGLLLARGFRAGPQMPHPDRYLVQLRLSEEEQRKSFGQTWRRQLAKAEKAGLDFERVGPERLGDFDALYSRMVERKGFEDRSAYHQTIPGLMALADDTARPELFLVSEGGEVIAGAIIFTAGDRAVYLYGATLDRALPLRAGYFLHWHIIAWLRENTVARWYDLGGTDGFQGLHQFKKGMVGEAGVITPVPAVANYASHWRARVFGNAAFAARDMLQELRARLKPAGGQGGET